MILDRYIARAVLAGAAMALLVLTSLDLFLALVGELEDAGQGGYGYLDALLYTLLTVPRRVYELFPAAVLVGGLVSLGTLASGSELVAMRAAGVSVGRIVRSAVQASLGLMLALFLLGEFLVPASEQYAEQLRGRLQNAQVVKAGKQGVWVRDDDLYIRIGRAYPDRKLEDVHLYRQAAGGGLAEVTVARAVFQHEKRWELRDVRHTRFQEDGVISETREVEFRPVLLDPSTLKVLDVEPETMSAWDLHHYVEYLQRNRLDATVYRLAFWLKITTPLSCVVMMLIVMPFVFGSLRSVNTGQLLIIGILLGLVFYILIQVASRVGQIYSIPPFVSATFPVLCFMILGLLGLTRVR